MNSILNHFDSSEGEYFPSPTWNDILCAWEEGNPLVYIFYYFIFIKLILSFAMYFIPLKMVKLIWFKWICQIEGFIEAVDQFIIHERRPRLFFPAEGESKSYWDLIITFPFFSIKIHYTLNIPSLCIFVFFWEGPMEYVLMYSVIASIII